MPARTRRPPMLLTASQAAFFANVCLFVIFLKKKFLVFFHICREVGGGLVYCCQCFPDSFFQFYFRFPAEDFFRAMSVNRYPIHFALAIWSVNRSFFKFSPKSSFSCNGVKNHLVSYHFPP